MFEAWPRGLERPGVLRTPRSPRTARTLRAGGRTTSARKPRMMTFESNAAPQLDDNGLLPGLPIALIRAAYLAAPGNEIESGKFRNRESSSALVANAFGPFFAEPEGLPPLPGTGDFAWPANFATPDTT